AVPAGTPGAGGRMASSSDLSAPAGAGPASTAGQPAAVAWTATNAAPGGSGPGAGPRPPRPIAEVEKQAIREALEWTQGNKAHAARLLGWTWQTLDNKVRRYRLAEGG
ncbi:MAG: helix-turn-helix domain-containing protein, partial [Candidatus Latescibacterota bacterium]